MPSTYTLNNGIELIATGEQSGTWGDTTNVNLGLIDTALDGQVTITLPAAGSSGSPNALAISDGSASNGRNRLIIFTDGGDLGATAFVQLTPNDAEKIVYIRNSLTGGRALTLFQGTYNASNDYEVPAGTTAVVFFNGGGSGAIAANVFNNAYFDSLRLGSVSVTAILDEDNMASNSATALATQQSIKAYVDAQVGANNELSEVLANGNTSGANNIQMTTTAEVQFRDTALKINSSADGQLDIDADVELELTAPTLDINASTAVTIDTATLTMTGSVNVVGDLDVDNLNLNGNAIISTNTNGNIDLTPNGTGEVNISKVDIDGGTIDGTVIGGSSAAAGTFTTATATTGNITTVNATTVDTTNIEVTTLKAKDGTAAGSIADSTGVVTLASSVLTTTDINGGTIDGTTIGGASAAAGTFTTATATTGNITTVNATTVDTTNIEVTTIKAKDGTSAGSIADSTGVVTLASSVLTTTDINGGTVDGAVIGGSSAAAITGTTITATGDVTIADKIVHAGDTNTAIRFPAADTVTVETSGIERLRIESQGRVGLGVTNPNLRLQVAAQSSSASTVIAATEVDYLANFRSSQLTYNPVDTTGTTLGVSNSNLGALAFLNCTNAVIGTNGATPLVFATTNTERMRITSTGLVGIGTTSPGQALSVNGSIDILASTTETRQLQIGFGRTGDGLSLIDFVTDATYTDFGMRISRSAGENGTSFINVRGTGGLDIRTTDAAPIVFLTSATERMRILSGGNVGIGTTTPATALDVNGDVTITDKIIHSGDTDTAIRFPAADTVTVETAGSERLRVDSSGNVGIGTSSPGVPLDVIGSIRAGSSTVAATAEITLRSGTTDSAVFRRYSVGSTEIRNTDGPVGLVSETGGVTFSASNTERMRITSGGNVLIGGTASPASAAASLAIFNGTAPTGSVTNGVVLYAEDVSSSSELKVRDEAGNVTTLSPHNFDLIPEGPSEDMAWSYYSERDGKRINVDMLKAIRLLESITGEKLVHIV
jgi:hypothetical protein